MQRIILVGAILISTLAPTAAQPKGPVTITKVEARSLPPQRVKARVMSQLSALLTEERWNRTKSPVNALTEMYFTTKPRAGAVPGLCRVDRLTVDFRPARRGSADANTPVVAEGISVDHFFHFKQAPRSHYNALVRDDFEPAESACDDVAFAKNVFVNAPSEEVATDGYFLGERAMSAISEGKVQFELDCEKFPTEKDRPCADIVREMKAAGINMIVECGAAEGSLDRCIQAYAGDRYIRLIASPIAYGPNALPPLTLRRVKIGSLIVLSHERID